MAFTVKLKVLSWFGDLRGLYELVGSQYLVGLAGSKSRWNVLDALRGKDNRLTLRTFNARWAFKASAQNPVRERLGAREIKLMGSAAKHALALPGSVNII